jgi:AraC-like DNA-binding protein
LYYIKIMIFNEIAPGNKLKPFIKCLYFYQPDSAVDYHDIVFPSGNMEVIFNLGSGNWQAKKGASYYTTPLIEFWGQITRPLAIKSIGRNTMFGIRFYPHTAAYFFNEKLSEFNNEVVDAADIFGPSLNQLHERLLEAPGMETRVRLAEDYFADRLHLSEKRHHKLKLVGGFINNLVNEGGTSRISDISARNRISSRYLNMLITEYTGLQPKLLTKINRFQHSLALVNSSAQNFTSIACEAGYFDQSHFIREFKSFTGTTPNTFAANASPINQLLAGN